MFELSVTDPQRVDLEQNTAEWLEWRASRYTASDAPAVMAQSPWFPRTPLELWQRRTGQKSVAVNAAMRAGHADEALAREILAREIKASAHPACWQATVNGMAMGASYDAYVECRDEVFEIKRPMKGTASDLWNLQEAGHYRWQMLHQLIVNPAIERVSLAVYAHDAKAIKICGTVSRFDPDFDAYASALVEAWRAFDQAIIDLRAPEPTDRDVVEVPYGDDDYEQLVTSWLAAKRMADEAGTRLETAREALLEAAKSRGDGLPVLGFGVKAYRTVRPGNVNWKAKEIAAALASAKVDPDKFRGKAIEAWTLREIEG